MPCKGYVIASIVLQYSLTEACCTQPSDGLCPELAFCIRSARKTCLNHGEHVGPAGFKNIPPHIPHPHLAYSPPHPPPMPPAAPHTPLCPIPSPPLPQRWCCAVGPGTHGPGPRAAPLHYGFIYQKSRPGNNDMSTFKLYMYLCVSDLRPNPCVLRPPIPVLGNDCRKRI